MSGPMGEGPLPDDDGYVVPVGHDDEIDESAEPRFVWGMSTNFAGITDRVNSGHFVWVPKRDSDAE